MEEQRGIDGLWRDTKGLLVREIPHRLKEIVSDGMFKKSIKHFIIFCMICKAADRKEKK